MTQWYPAVKINDIPMKEGVKVVYGDKEIAVFNLGDEFFAMDNRCPHRQGPLADGIVSGKTVTCPLHGLNISLETGCALKGGEGRVNVYPTKIGEEYVYIEL